MEVQISELKKEIIDQLNLNIEADQIGDDEPLFIKGLGLDSIDALELIVLLQKNYDIKLNSAEEGKDVFYSVKTMADYINERRNPKLIK